MTISIRLTDEEEASLDGLARRTGRSKSFYVRMALHEYLADLEDAFAADAAIDAFEAGGRRSRPLPALKSKTVE
jgi:RHH-type rel operon transcriptional repressor/antitoxin RelB